MKQNKPYLLVSRCLLGCPCRYDGRSVPSPAVMALAQYAEFVSVCPESDGGMPTPRIPSERQGERVVNRVGEDVTAFYRKGAEAAKAIAEEKHIPFAILKEKSPSCGTKLIYDGSFMGKTVDGEGVTAELLKKAGVVLFSEEDVKDSLPDALRKYLNID